MKFNFHIHHHYDADVDFMLREILRVVNEIKKKGGDTIMKLEALEAQVKASTQVEASAVLLIQGIAAQLADAAGDPVKIAALETELRQSADSLAAAVLANTVPA